jgi:hypothetical protein
MPESLAARIPVRADILTHEVTDSDEIVIYDSDHRQLLVLNDFAAGVWLLIDGERSIEDLRNCIVECVDADSDTVSRDVEAFVQQLADRKIVQWRTA